MEMCTNQTTTHNVKGNLLGAESNAKVMGYFEGGFKFEKKKVNQNFRSDVDSKAKFENIAPEAQVGVCEAASKMYNQTANNTESAVKMTMNN